MRAVFCLFFLHSTLLVAPAWPQSTRAASQTDSPKSSPMSSSPTPEERAIALLAREVPAWHAENNCYSCHNNADAARALYMATRLDYDVPAESLADTTGWLVRPHDWDHNGGESGFADKHLATVQFATALVAAIDAGAVKERETTALKRAAEKVAEYQQPDGSWKAIAPGLPGAPATLGNALATVSARQVLARADAENHSERIASADRWLRAEPPKSVLVAASLLYGLAEADDAAAVRQRRACLELIRRGQAPEGGWGPFVEARTEAFDTALVLLALVRLPDDREPDVRAMLARGRAYLVATQQPNGAWPATTRPADGDSYAEWTSTAAWSTLALLATRDLAEPGERRDEQAE